MRTFLPLHVLITTSLLAANPAPLEKFVQQRGFRYRPSQNSFSLLGEVYPDDNVTIGNRVARAENCWPTAFIQKIHSTTYQGRGPSGTEATIQRTNIDTLLKFGKKGADTTGLQAEFHRLNITTTALEYRTLFEVNVATADIIEQVKTEQCKQWFFDERNRVITGALAANELRYTFFNDKGTVVNITGTKASDLLVQLGLAKTTGSIGTMESTEPIYVGFQLGKWCKARNEYLDPKKPCKQ